MIYCQLRHLRYRFSRYLANLFVTYRSCRFFNDLVASDWKRIWFDLEVLLVKIENPWNGIQDEWWWTIVAFQFLAVLGYVYSLPHQNQREETRIFPSFELPCHLQFILPSRTFLSLPRKRYGIGMVVFSFIVSLGSLVDSFRFHCFSTVKCEKEPQKKWMTLSIFSRYWWKIF